MKKGFTLIELMVVISIIALIMSIIVASLLQARVKAKISAGLLFESQTFTGRGDKLLTEMLFENSLSTDPTTYPTSIAGSGTSYSTDVANKTGASFSFSGSGYVRMDNISPSRTSYGVGFWFKTSSQNGGMYEVTGGGYDRSIFIRSGQVCANLGSGNSGDLQEEICSPNFTYADGQWHYVYHTFGGNVGGQELYVDGALVNKGSKSTTTFNGQIVLIGYAGASGQFFNGLIDQLRIYDISLKE